MVALQRYTTRLNMARLGLSTVSPATIILAISYAPLICIFHLRICAPHCCVGSNHSSVLLCWKQRPAMLLFDLASTQQLVRVVVKPRPVNMTLQLFEAC